MKLWLLRPIETNDDAWKPQDDKAFGFVVRAENEQAARAFAHGTSGYETYEDRTPWLDPAQSTCVELTPAGEPGIVMEDFANG